MNREPHSINYHREPSPHARWRAWCGRHLLNGLLLIVLLSSRSFAAEPATLRQWDFDSPADIEGWLAGSDVADLHITEKCLIVRMTGPDTHIVAPPLDVPLDGCTIRIRLRCDRNGYTQVYWQTDEYRDFAEERQMTRTMPAEPAATDERGFTTLDFPIGTLSDAGRRLTAFRIDPCNGNETGTVKIDSVTVLRMPAVWDARLTTDTHWCQVNQPVTARFIAQQVAGGVDSMKYTVIMPSAGTRILQPEPGTPAELSCPVQTRQAGVCRTHASLLSSSSQSEQTLTASFIVGQGETLPLKEGIRNDRVRLDFVPDTTLEAVAAARWSVRDVDGEWQLAGWLLPLADLTVHAADGTIIQAHPLMVPEKLSDRQILLRSSEASLPEGWTIELMFDLVDRNGLPAIDTRARLTGSAGARLLDFAAPVLRADPAGASEAGNDGTLLDRYALFGGLEFLEPLWPSSSPRSVGQQFADRRSPHPFKITVPVMAVESAGITTCLMWPPLQAWDGRECMPAATFASPNFIDRQPNHLMRLSVPSIPRWREENTLAPVASYTMSADGPIELNASLYAEQKLPVALAARRWYELFGPPVPPSPPHNDIDTYNLCARHLGETVYWPEEKGWRHHWYLDTKSTFIPWMAAELIAHAAATKDPSWIARTDLTGKTIIDTAGTLADSLSRPGPADARIAAMRPDGTWAFTNTPGMREQTRKFTHNQYDSLGEDGSTSLGTCVQAALPILQRALLTGERKYVDVGVRALQAMRQFRVPRGAQVWEVHQEIPDIRAAALAVEAFHIGYQLTGDPRFLVDANYWAWTGASFAYSWQVPIEQTVGLVVASRDRDPAHVRTMPLADAFENPERTVTPYGTVPVLGPTFYVINWYGVLVQWCGLEWAWKVIELDRDRPDPLLRYIADGVVLSGQQQTFDRPPWTGLYPDVWDLRMNRAQGAFISAHLPMMCLQAQDRQPRLARPWTRVLHAPDIGRPWHVSGWGRPITLASPSRVAWEATIEFLPDQPSELILAGVPEPHRVLVDNDLLEAHKEAEVATETEGWRYDPSLQAVLIRFTHQRTSADVRVQW